MRDDSPWIAMIVEVPAHIEEDLVADIGSSSLGVESFPAGHGGVCLRIYLTGERTAAAALEGAAGWLRTRGLDPDACGLRTESVEDGRWVECYQASLRPFPIGRRFVVIPWGGAPPGLGREPILLVPGRAFGTGEHSTTRLCVEALERWVRPGTRWLDLGTGSGILAVVAARCGAAAVEALDIDPDAVEVAREVADANGVGDRIRVRLGSLDARDRLDLDGCVANVATPYFLRHAQDLAGVLPAPGVLLVSGILGEDVPDVERALAVVGFRIVERSDDGAWSLLAARRGD